MFCLFLLETIKLNVNKLIFGMRRMDNEKVKVMCWGNNYLAPCTSPFNLKLQTYLRMAGIDYEVITFFVTSVLFEIK